MTMLHSEDNRGGECSNNTAATSATSAQRDWYAASRAQVLRAASPLSYHEYVKRSATIDATPLLEDDRRQIELDLQRTSVSICEYILHITVPDDEHETDSLAAPFKPMLRNILRAYSVRNPRVGYVQGHADVVCFIIGHNNDERNEEQVFWVYASVLECVFPDDFFARSPKLHGFHVDNRLFKELVTRKLVPLTPALAAIDLTLVTSLLACKWFVSLWVGHLPLEALVRVWDVMLSDDTRRDREGDRGGDNGAILHLLLALEFFQTAIDSVLIHMATDEWDSSYLYQIILRSSSNNNNNNNNNRPIDPLATLERAQTIYSLNDEAIEDLRSTLRLDPTLQRAEVAALAQTTTFIPSELIALQEEFTFARFATKALTRTKLRGVRSEFVASVIARAFATWPVDSVSRLFQLMTPDGYGNVSFANLVQLLSVLTRGDADAKAALLFAMIDVQSVGVLDRTGIDQLADLLCCLFANKTLAGTLSSSHTQLLHSTDSEAAHHRPLLRRQFRQKLFTAAPTNEQLDLSCWRNVVRSDVDIASLLDWHTPEEPTNADDVIRSSKEIDDPNDQQKQRIVSLLAPSMRKKLELSRAWMLVGSDSDDSNVDGLRRNPFEHHPLFGSDPSGNGDTTQQQQLYWCQCVLS